MTDVTHLSCIQRLEITHLDTMSPWNDKRMSPGQGLNIQERQDMFARIDDHRGRVCLVGIQTLGDPLRIVQGMNWEEAGGNGAERTTSLTLEVFFGIRGFVSSRCRCFMVTCHLRMDWKRQK